MIFYGSWLCVRMQGLNRKGNAFYDKAARFRMPVEDLFREVEPHFSQSYFYNMLEYRYLDLF